MDTTNSSTQSILPPGLGGGAPTSPIARGPLVDLHRRENATLGIQQGWEIALRYSSIPKPGASVLVDLSHLPTFEINGPGTGSILQALCSSDVPVRTVHQHGRRHTYRLSDRRAIVFCPPSEPLQIPDAIDVTGGWATISLIGSDAPAILSKVTAVDLRPETLPLGDCCQGPVFGVNTLFGRFEHRFDLHICSDSAEFFWEVLMDAGQEVDLKPAGIEFFNEFTS